MRKLKAFILVLVVLLSITPLCYAHPFSDQKKEMQYVLFGRDNYYASQPKKQRDAIDALAYAQNLVTDEFNGDTTPVFAERLSFLQNLGVQGLPTGIEEIDFKYNSGHEKFVNIRWEPYETPQKGNWKVRKNILLTTVNKVFDFGMGTDIYLFGNNPLVPYEKQCDAFAALLFYVHQIGDIETTAYKAYVFPLARQHPGEGNADILWDLMEIYLPSLFPSQVDSDEYKNLFTELGRLATDARELAGSVGGINSEEKEKRIKAYAQETIQILSRYIPKMLHNETFFINTFPEFY